MAIKRRQRVVGFGVVSAALVGFAGVSIVMASNQCVGQIECDSEAGRAIDASLPTDSVAQIEPSTTVPVVAAIVNPAASAATAPETTPPSTAPPTTVLQDIPLFAVGESVMLGAKPVLDARGFKTAAEVSKGPDWELEQLQLAKSKYHITYGVVIQLGTNGTVTCEQYEAVLDQVKDQDKVVMMTVKAPKPWIAGNNEIIRSLPATHPNVILLDWEARAAEIEGHLSGSDGGIHLSDDYAKQFYRDIILQAFGLPT